MDFFALALCPSLSSSSDKVAPNGAFVACYKAASAVLMSEANSALLFLFTTLLVLTSFLQGPFNFFRLGLCPPQFSSDRVASNEALVACNKAVSAVLMYEASSALLFFFTTLLVLAPFLRGPFFFFRLGFVSFPFLLR